MNQVSLKRVTLKFTSVLTDNRVLTTGGPKDSRQGPKSKPKRVHFADNVIALTRRRHQSVYTKQYIQKCLTPKPPNYPLIQAEGDIKYCIFILLIWILISLIVVCETVFSSLKKD
jgi:hypothetical protein